MISESEINELRTALTAANAKVAELVRERNNTETRCARLAEALKFYADRRHYQLSDDWQSASDDGETDNFLCAPQPSEIDLSEYPCGLLDWLVEDGSIARAALSDSNAQAIVPPVGSMGCYTNALKALFALALFFVLTVIACVTILGIMILR